MATTSTPSGDTGYCNWIFWEVITKGDKWGIQRDCDTTPLVQQKGYGLYDFHDSVTLMIRRGDSRNWKAYKASLEPRFDTDAIPSDNTRCPNCHKYINGVNPYDDGETWRK